MTIDDVYANPIWRHMKSGGLYHVLGVGLCSTNGRTEQSVVYFSIEYQGLRYRELNEFLDGRFVPEPRKLA